MSHGKSAAFAWQVAFTRHADRLAGLKNELLAARANDLRDVGRRVLQQLTGVEAEPRRLPGRHDPDRRGAHAVRHRRR